MSYLMHNYKRFPLSFSFGRGAYLFTQKGVKYLDFMSGVAVNALGHAHPIMAKAAEEQAKKLFHVSNIYTIPEQEKLAKKLCTVTGYDAAYFCNSGAEANEAALKIARKHTGKKVFVSFQHSFHGRTFGALSVTGKESIQKDFAPLLADVRIIEWNNEKELEKAMQDDVAAIIFELIQAEGGIHTIEKPFLQKIMLLAKQKGILVIVDEVQTGVGRTGTFLFQEQFGIKADIITLAKGLGGGLPIGAMLARAEVAQAFSPGSHGSTFAGSPFVSSVALAVLQKIAQPRFLESVKESSAYFFAALQKMQKQFPKIFLELRGKGFLIGLEMPSADTRDAFIQTLMKKYHVLTIGAGEKTLRILPPLIATKKEIDICLQALESTASQVESLET